MSLAQQERSVRREMATQIGSPLGYAVQAQLWAAHTLSLTSPELRNQASQEIEARLNDTMANIVASMEFKCEEIRQQWQQRFQETEQEKFTQSGRGRALCPIRSWLQFGEPAYLAGACNSRLSSGDHEGWDDNEEN